MVRNLALIGPMGAGKSTVGKLLAAKLHFDFVDTDHEIEARTGADIPWIFDVEGEEGFRIRETKVLSEVVERKNAVIATGGGIVVRDENHPILARAGTVIYLAASIEHLTERTFKDKKRPLLQVEDPKSRIIELYQQRDPLYRSLSDHIVTTDSNSPKHVVQSILKLL